MPPICFYGNYNRYKGQDKHYLVEQILSYKTPFLSVVITISYAFSPAMNKNLQTVLEKICKLVWKMACFCVALATSEKHHPQPHCAHIRCLVSLNTQQASMNVSAILSMEELNSTSLLLIHFMSDAILSDCSSAAICHTATKCNEILLGCLNLHCNTITACLCHGPA